MYSNKYNIPNNNNYRSETITYQVPNQSYPYTQTEEDRFFLAPFLVGGLAGTALGYGIANNNQINGGCCQGYYQPIYQPIYSYPYPVNTSNNYYY